MRHVRHVSRASVETRPRPALVPVSLAVVSRVAIWPPAQYYAHQAEICKVGIVRYSHIIMTVNKCVTMLRLVPSQKHR